MKLKRKPPDWQQWARWATVGLNLAAALLKLIKQL